MLRARYEHAHRTRGLGVAVLRSEDVWHKRRRSRFPNNPGLGAHGTRLGYSRRMTTPATSAVVSSQPASVPIAVIHWAAP